MSETVNYNESTAVVASLLNQMPSLFEEPVVQPGDEEKSPKYLRLPGLEDAGRVMFAGVVTEINDVGSDQNYYQIRVVTGDGDNVYCYAGQYDKPVLQFVKNIETPVRVAVTGKPRQFTDDNGTTYVNVRPEEMAEISDATHKVLTLRGAETALEALPAIEDEDVAGAIEEGAHAALRDVADISLDEEEDDLSEADEESEEPADGGETEGGLEPVEIAQAAGIQPNPAEAIAETYDDPEMVVTAAEEETLDSLNGVGHATVSAIQENADAVEAIA